MEQDGDGKADQDGNQEVQQPPSSMRASGSSGDLTLSNAQISESAMATDGLDSPYSTNQAGGNLNRTRSSSTLLRI